MRLLKCPKCGEMFSDTYKTCPFCQEDEELHSGKPVKTGGRRVGGAKARPKVGGGVVVACLVLVLGLVACTIFGSQFTELFTGGKADTPVQALTLSQRNADLTVGSTVKLTASGGESIVSFSSSNEAVATVSADGTVKAVGEGSAVVTAKAGDLTASCSVAVKGTEQTDMPATNTLFLQSSGGLTGQFSMDPGETASVKVVGSSAPVTWSSSDSQIATVDASGIVTGVSSGSAIITAVVDGQTLTIEVLVR
ncbi:MAG: hypothetical protein EGQ48_01735 [Clostridiales bacterium]|nr:hypothetical protein [Clostridiales bacterium]